MIVVFKITSSSSSAVVSTIGDIAAEAVSRFFYNKFEIGLADSENIAVADIGLFTKPCQLSQ
jgi:hypothetical protein